MGERQEDRPERIDRTEQDAEEGTATRTAVTLLVLMGAGSSVGCSSAPPMILPPSPGETAEVPALEKPGGPQSKVADHLPEVVTKVEPIYPEIARVAGIDGTVVVEALVGTDGRVSETRLMKSIPMLDAAAVEAVRQWQFKPATLKGQAMTAWVMCPVQFARP